MKLIPSVELAEAARRDRRRRKDPARAALWGLPWLAMQLPPPVPGSLCVIGAGTNVGKTFAALMLARGQAESGPVVFYSLEDPPREIGRRLNAGLAHPNLFVVFPERNNLSRITASMEGLRELAPAFVWLDYIQLLLYDLPGAWSKADSVGRSVGEYKACLKSLGCPGGATSQLRRVGSEERGMFPTIDLLKESGDIENQADVILLLGGKAKGTRVTMEVSKAKNAAVGGRLVLRRTKGGVLVPVATAGEGVEAGDVVKVGEFE